MDLTELAWAGGLFEGEGTIGCWNNNPSGKQIVSRIVMTDDDVLARFVATLAPLPLKVRASNRTYGTERKLRFTVDTGRFETTQALIAMLWPWLCTRRRRQARDALLAYRAHYGY